MYTDIDFDTINLNDDFKITIINHNFDQIIVDNYNDIIIEKDNIQIQ